LDSPQVLIALLITIWVAGGAAVATVMRRSGHNFSFWLTLGILLGPLTAFFAQERHRLDLGRGIGRAEEFRSGRFDALAGIDGSEESIAAVRTALSLLGGTFSSLTLVTALDYEASGSFTGITSQSDAYSRLADVASHLDFEPIEKRLIYGSPAKTIASFAQEGGFELIILGARGHGMSKALFGSVTAKLTGGTRIPVFVGPAASPEVFDTETWR
jgi:nucleotide-binding universal stress UspA family protein